MKNYIQTFTPKNIAYGQVLLALLAVGVVRWLYWWPAGRYSHLVPYIGGSRQSRF